MFRLNEVITVVSNDKSDIYHTNGKNRGRNVQECSMIQSRAIMLRPSIGITTLDDLEQCTNVKTVDKTISGAIFPLVSHTSVMNVAFKNPRQDKWT